MHTLPAPQLHNLQAAPASAPALRGAPATAASRDTARTTGFTPEGLAQPSGGPAATSPAAAVAQGQPAPPAPAVHAYEPLTATEVANRAAERTAELAEEAR